MFLFAKFEVKIIYLYLLARNCLFFNNDIPLEAKLKFIYNVLRVIIIYSL